MTELGGVRSGSLIEQLRADFAGLADLKGRKRSPAATAVDLMGLPGWWAVVLFRVSCSLHHAGLRPLSRMVYFLNYVLFGIELYPGSEIGPGLVTPHPIGIGIAKEVVIGRNFHALAGVRIGGGTADATEGDGYPVIGDDCWMLDGAKAFGPVHIGDGAMIGANSLVTGDVPSHVVAAGVPARVIRSRLDGAAAE